MLIPAVSVEMVEFLKNANELTERSEEIKEAERVLVELQKKESNKNPSNMSPDMKG